MTNICYFKWNSFVKGQMKLKDVCNSQVKTPAVNVKLVTNPPQFRIALMLFVIKSLNLRTVFRKKEIVVCNAKMALSYLEKQCKAV